MKKFLVAIAIMGVSVLSCRSLVHLKSKDGGSGGGQAIKPVLFDDYEGAPGEAYSYGDTANGGACNKPEITDTEKHGGSKSLMIKYTSGTGTWGCGFDTFSGNNPKEGYFDVDGATGIEFWAKIPIGVNIQAMCKEGKANGGDDEVYLFSEVTGNGRWKKYFVKFDAASRGIYSGNQGGDDELTTSSISAVMFQLNSNQGDGTLYLDDMYFK